MIITGTDLQQYVDSRNLEFTGISREEYQQTKALPEGNYQICFTAFDFARPDVPVSESACSFFWLAKSEPPLINLPPCGTALPFQNPQQIIFSWLPRNTSSPSSVASTEYEFSLYEIRPAGRNPNDIVLSTQPVYRVTTALTQILYGPAEPVLLQNMTYVWRVRAVDTGGTDAFRNNGYSEICTFTYGGEGNTVQLVPIDGLQAEGETERSAKAWWTPQPEADGYQAHYKKKGSGHKWFTSQTEEDTLSFFELEPDTEYELRVQPVAGASYGPYSDIKQFKTLPRRVYQCGEEAPPVPEPGPPIPFVTAGMIIDVQGIEMTIREVSGPAGEGLYSGKGEVSIPYFGGAVFNVAFNQLYINDKRAAASGRIDFITKKVDEWIEDELERQRKEKLAAQQQDNRDQWKGTDFHDKVFYYDGIAIDSMYVNGDGEVVMKDEDGKLYINKDIPVILADAPEKAIIIEDKNGDQWVVQAGGKVTKVQGGGLSPTMDVIVSQEALDVIAKALTGLSVKYNKDLMNEISKEAEIKKELLDAYVHEQNNAIFGSSQNDDGSLPGEEETRLNEEDTWFSPRVPEMPLEEVDDEISGVDEQLSVLSNAYYKKLREFKTGAVIGLFAQPANISESGKMIAPGLKIDNKTVAQFIEQQKAQQTAEKEIVDRVMLGIEDLLDVLFKESVSLENIKFKRED
jgi:hypothetical protein